MVAEDREVDPVEWDENPVVEVTGTDAMAGVLSGEVGKISAEQWPAMGSGFEQRQAEALADGGGDEVAAVCEPRLKIWRSSGGGGVASDDVELDGQPLFPGKFLPSVMHWLCLRIQWRAAHGEMAARRG